MVLGAMAVSDEDLVTRGQDGDAGAVDELLRRHFDRIHNICRRITGNETDALDATQEALLSIVRGLTGFDNRSKFSTWSYRVATNACLDELRRHRRRPEPIEKERLPLPSKADTFTDDLGLSLEIEAALASIPEQYRAPVVLRDLCDLDYAEISEVLELAPGTVRSRIARGRAALAELLAPSRTSSHSEEPISGNQLPELQRPTEQS
jgi:RNA polymerase sigma-70 factor (ECF subfamily)